MDGSTRAIPGPFPYQYAEGFAIDYNGGLWIWDAPNSTWKNITGGGPGAYEPIIPFGTAAQYWTGQKLWATLVTTVVPEGTNKYYTTARALADVTWATITGKPATFPPDAEGVDDRVAAFLQAGTNITLTYDDAGNRLTINSTGGGGGGVTSVTGTAPVVSSGGATPAISMPAATASVSGHLTAADWTTFNGKQAFIASGSAAQYYRGDKTWANLDKAAVGLGNVDNTSDVNKPISTATQTALNGKEPTIAAGDPAMFWAGDKTWKPASGGTGGAIVSDTPPASPASGQIWWESDTGALFIYYMDPNTNQWVQVNGNGLPEAPDDAKPYARQGKAWFDLTATLAAKADDADLSYYLPLSGGTLSGSLTAAALIANTYVSVPSGYVTAARPSGGYAGTFTDSSGSQGGVLGYSASYYGIVGYVNTYACYGNGSYYGNGCNFQGPCTCNVATTTSSATGYLSTGGGMYRSTSLGIYKSNIEPILPEFADKVLQLKTIFYRPNEKTVDPTDWSRFGFLTEDAYAVDFRFSTCGEDLVIGPDGKAIPILEELMLPDPNDHGKIIPTLMPSSGWYEENSRDPAPHDVDLKAIVACLLDVVRRQGDRIAALEATSGV